MFNKGHPGLAAHALQRPDALCGLRLHRVRQRQQQHRALVDGHEDHRLAVVLQGVPWPRNERKW